MWRGDPVWHDADADALEQPHGMSRDQATAEVEELLDSRAPVAGPVGSRSTPQILQVAEDGDGHSLNASRTPDCGTRSCSSRMLCSLHERKASASSADRCGGASRLRPVPRTDR